MKKAATLGIAAAAAAALTACNTNRDHEEGGGPTVNRTYQVGAFDRIEVAGPYDVTVTTGSGPTVAASGREKDIEKMVVEVDGTTLRIHTRKRKMNFGWSNRGKVTLQVSVPALAAAGIAGSGNINVDKVAGDNFSGEVAGSGNISLAQVEVKQIKMAIAGSGEIRAGAGRALAADYEIAGSGDIGADSLVAETARVSIAGSGNVRAHATRLASVDIAGSGDVDLKGGAKCTVSKHGSGNVRCS